MFFSFFSFCCSLVLCCNVLACVDLSGVVLYFAALCCVGLNRFVVVVVSF